MFLQKLLLFLTNTTHHGGCLAKLGAILNQIAILEAFLWHSLIVMETVGMAGNLASTVTTASLFKQLIFITGVKKKILALM